MHFCQGNVLQLPRHGKPSECCNCLVQVQTQLANHVAAVGPAVLIGTLCGPAGHGLYRHQPEGHAPAGRHPAGVPGVDCGPARPSVLPQLDFLRKDSAQLSSSA